MSYLERLKAAFPEKSLQGELKELKEAPSFSFCSSLGRRNTKVEAFTECLASTLDPAAEARRTRVLDMLIRSPGARYSAVTDSQSDPEAVIVTLAIRGRATCELRVPRDRYDGVLLFELI